MHRVKSRSLLFPNGECHCDHACEFINVSAHVSWSQGADNTSDVGFYHTLLLLLFFFCYYFLFFLLFSSLYLVFNKAVIQTTSGWHLYKHYLYSLSRHSSMVRLNAVKTFTF